MNAILLFTNGTELNFNVTFNFSFAQALDVLEEHFAKDKIFEHYTEAAIIAFYVVLMVMGLCCNLLVCGVVLANTKIRYSITKSIISLWLIKI